MRWHNPETKEFYSKGPLKTKDGTIFNPTESVLRRYGFEPFIEPVPQPPQPPTPSERRRQEYQIQTDELSTTYVGYVADINYAKSIGDETLAAEYEKIANEILAKIGQKKAQIRKDYPDTEEA